MSISPSVRQTRIVTKRKKLVTTILYHMKDRLSELSDQKNSWWRGRNFLPKIFCQTDPVRAKTSQAILMHSNISHNSLSSDQKWKYNRFAYAQWKIRNITHIYGRIAEISLSQMKSWSKNTTVTSDFRPEVEIWLFRACAMHPVIIIGTVRPLWT